MTDKKPRGRPRKEKTIYAKKEPELVNEVVVPITEPPKAEFPKAEPSIAEVVPITEVKTESVKIPIKVPKKKGKQDKLQGKQILTIIDDEPVKPVVEPIKPVAEPIKPVAEPIKPKKAPRIPRVPRVPKAKPVQPKDENLYKMVYQLQQSLQQKTSPRKKTSKYVSSDDEDDSEEEDSEEDDDVDERYHKKIQKRLETVQHIEQRLKQVRQPQPKGKYDHLSIF
jgi:hypothetical protein